MSKPRGFQGGAAMIQGEWVSKQLAKNPMGQQSSRIGPFEITREAERAAKRQRKNQSLP
jgi:hypothetical protein